MAHLAEPLMPAGGTLFTMTYYGSQRVVANYNNNKAKLSKFHLNFYGLNKKGEYGAGSLWAYSVNARGERHRARYAVHDGKENKLHDMAYLYEVPDV